MALLHVTLTSAALKRSVPMQAILSAGRQLLVSNLRFRDCLAEDFQRVLHCRPLEDSAPCISRGHTEEATADE